MDEKKWQEERKKMKGWTWKQGSNEGKDGDEEIHEDVRKEGGEKATFKGKTEERKNEDKTRQKEDWCKRRGASEGERKEWGRNRKGKGGGRK